MSFDGIVIAALVRELNEALAGGRIDKIYQPESAEIILRIQKGGQRSHLLLSASGAAPRLHLTDQLPANPEQPAAFCMLLRKLLQGGRIEEIRQRSSDRIIDFTITAQDEMGFPVARRLTVEIMGKHSNIIVMQPDTRIILDCIKRISPEVNRYRSLLPGVPYLDPPDHGKHSFFGWNPEQIAEMLMGNLSSATETPTSEGVMANTVTTGTAAMGRKAADTATTGTAAMGRKAADTVTTGTAAVSAVEAAGAVKKASGRLAETFAGISPTLAAALTEGMSDTDSKWAETASLRLFSCIELLREEHDSSAGFAPTVYLDQDNRPVDFHIFPLPDRIRSGLVSRPFASLNQAINFYYDKQATTGLLRQRGQALAHSLRARLDKLELKKQRLTEDRNEAESSEALRLYGELLTANLHLVPAGANLARVPNYYDGGTMEIPLDPRFSGAQNAQRYYKKYGKMKTAIREKQLQIEEVSGQIEYLESVQTFLEQAATEPDLDALRQELTETGILRPERMSGKQTDRRRATSGKRSGYRPLSFLTPDGYTVLVGRNNLENDYMTFKLAAKSDLWLHTKDIPGSHVLLRTDGRDASETALRTAAGLAAWFSKARLSNNVPVDYVPIRYVKKPAGAKPGKVIFTHNRTLFVAPLEPPEPSRR